METPITVNGWSIYLHPIFFDQIESYIDEILELKEKTPSKYKSKNVSKRLRAIQKLAFDIIPQDPLNKIYRQGETLGEDKKHWFRAKFYQQYRLFFRFDTKARVIIYAWVNDEKTKRAYGSKTDAYEIFKKKLKEGRPPDDWETLLKEAKNAVGKLATIKNIIP